MARSLAVILGTLAVLFVVPTAGGTTATARTAFTECEHFCEQEGNPELPPGRHCTLEDSPDEDSGPFQGCETKDGVPSLCMLAYGVEHCHECDIDWGDCEGSDGSLAAAAHLSPSGTVVPASENTWKSEDGALRSGCSGLVVGYSRSAQVLQNALGTLQI